jgi:hypothetical protein
LFASSCIESNGVVGGKEVVEHSNKGHIGKSSGTIANTT